MSDPFEVGNGVRQGSLLSPYLFNVYMDDLSKILNSCKTGCMIGDRIMNHLMYGMYDVCGGDRQTLCKKTWRKQRSAERRRRVSWLVREKAVAQSSGYKSSDEQQNRTAGVWCAAAGGPRCCGPLAAAHRKS